MFRLKKKIHFNCPRVKCDLDIFFPTFLEIHPITFICKLNVLFIGTDLMVLSEEPLTTSLSLYCRQAIPRL